MRVLGIETSCDETGVALVEDGNRVLAEAVASQEQIHAPFAGVVPELASRQHSRFLPALLQKVLGDASCDPREIDLIAVTRGPGLAGCLLVGVAYAKALGYALGIPVLGVDHCEAHLYTCYLAGGVDHPAVALLVSGGHTLLVRVARPGRYEMLGTTRDDAVGEAFDKVASMLGLPFPGGPAMEARAKGRPSGDVAGLPRPLIRSGDLNFSFSGLKTAVLYRLRARSGTPLSEGEIDGLAREFQNAVVEVLVEKAREAVTRARAKSILLAGGVAQNEALREALRRAADEEGVRLVCAPKRYCTDNGVMVAALGHHKFAGGARDDLSLDIAPGLRLV